MPEASPDKAGSASWQGLLAQAPLPCPRIGRRTFLVAGGLAVLAAACGSDKEASPAYVASTLGQSNDPIQGGAAAADLFASAGLRFPFGVLRNSRDGLELITKEAVTIGFRGPNGKTIVPTPATFRGAGLDTGQHQHADGVNHVHDFERKGIYVVSTEFPVAGVWTADLDVAGEPGHFAFEVFADPRAPMVKERAPAVASPTTSDPLDVDPVCTRDPACPLHEASLSDAIGANTPVVVLFSTPTRCQSRWCGPVLELLLDVRKRYVDRATFIHVEIYRDLQADDLVPTVASWGLESEPWLYAIDGGGTIVDRLEGAFDLDEITALVDAVTS